uniref:Ribonuclease VapC n=1 Tax=Geoglobus ahangari TaxID=113653 RepID=A0A7C3UBI2_9EURY
MGGVYVILLDTNVFYNFLFETELTDKAAGILEMDEEFCTTFTVLNELVYIISRKLAERKYGIRSYYDFRSLIASEGYNFCSQEIKSLMRLFEDLKIDVLNDYQDLDEVCTIMRTYKLLPNDALIAATCKHYGIKKIATFDEDFKRIDFLEVVEI